MSIDNKFSILIGTCDRYSYLWENFVYLFNKYWDDKISIRKFFMTETVVNESLDGFKFIKNGKIPYSNCLINSLNQIDTPYVLWLQDDYFLRKTISKEEFEDYFRFIETNNVDRFGICQDTSFYNKNHVIGNIYKLNKNSKYSISMQASIWNVNFFKSCLIKNENPWTFETVGTKRLNKREHNTYLSIQETPWYSGVVKRGKYTENYQKILKEENLEENETVSP